MSDVTTESVATTPVPTTEQLESGVTALLNAIGHLRSMGCSFGISTISIRHGQVYQMRHAMVLHHGPAGYAEEISL